MSVCNKSFNLSSAKAILRLFQICCYKKKDRHATCSCPQVQSGQEDPLEKDMATHFSILAWRISWAKEPDELQSIRLQRVGHD